MNKWAKYARIYVVKVIGGPFKSVVLVDLESSWTYFLLDINHKRSVGHNTKKAMALHGQNLCVWLEI